MISCMIAYLQSLHSIKKPTRKVKFRRIDDIVQSYTHQSGDYLRVYEFLISTRDIIIFADGLNIEFSFVNSIKTMGNQT